MTPLIRWGNLTWPKVGEFARPTGRVNPESKVRGVGLGLPFVKRIVSLHGGHTELISDAGQGSSFCVWLPQLK
jgi:signal transduction histidine kinase